jgi:hypothetical protein
MNRHATLDELARLGADDLRSRKAARVSNHLAGCTRCTELNNELSSIPVLLSSIQFPEMPANLAVMIDNTLAAEAAQRVAAEPATEAERRDLPVRAGRIRARRGLDRPRTDRAPWRLPVPATRVLATAAAIIVVGIGAYAIASHGGVSSSGTSSAAASPPLSSQVSLGPSVTYRQDDSSKSIQTVTANANVQPATMAGQAEAALTAAKMEGMRASPAKSGIYSSSLAAPTSTGPVNGSSTFGTTGAGTASTNSLLGGCIARVVPPGQALLMVERARFEGKPATIIVTAPAMLSGTSPPKQAQIWAVGDACSATNSHVLDHVKVARL